MRSGPILSALLGSILCFEPLLVRASLLAQAPPAVGDELMVNEVTTGRQLNASLATLGNGDVVVVWEGEDADGRGLFGRRVDDSALPVGSEFQVSVATTGNQVSAEVEATADGGFVVVWESDIPGYPAIGSRYFDSLGNPSSEFELAPHQAGIDVFDPKIAGLPDSTFVVVWDEYDSNMLDGSVRGRFLNTSGGATGGSFVLPTDGAASNVYAPQLASREGGGFFVTWQYNGGASGLWAQAFTDTAVADSMPWQVISSSSSYESVTGMTDGGFVLAWRSPVDGAKRRRFDSSGSPSPEVDVSTSADSQRWTDVTALPGGRAALVWSTASATDPNTNPHRVDAQLIGAGSGVDSEWTVDTSAISLFASRVAYDTVTGDLIVVWTRRFPPGGDQEDILLRRYELEPPLFVDGFESGDTTEWSSSR